MSWPSFAKPQAAMLLADREALLVDGGPRPDVCWNASQECVLVPGSFNPLHEGHLALAACAARLEARPAAFELSIHNVDKPALAPAEVQIRTAQFAGRAPIWLTRAPRFLDKARLFPGALFVIGADTALRLADARYYDDDRERLARAFAYFRGQGCRFLVAGRVDVAGRYLTLDDVPIPRDQRDLFRAIPEREFRMDVSSSEIRKSV